MEPIKPRASTRISIQWSDQPAAEETDTLVLTFPWQYLDLRVYRSGHPQEGTIQWAQAGHVEQLPSTKDSPALEFRPVISSVPAPPPGIEPLPDQGTFGTLPNGDVEERGKMFNPSERENQDYIEVWRRLALDGTWNEGGDPPCLLLECPPGDAEPEVHAFVGRIGPYALGIARIASPNDPSATRFIAWREMYDAEESVWRRVCSVGLEEEATQYLPSMGVFTCGSHVGLKQVVGEREWAVLYSSNTD
ncbi:hypothetical protein NCC49_000744 [Naganishia albida]|nr:hypothetical protein NCC49_000744 [Naganishia albida]